MNAAEVPVPPSSIHPAAPATQDAQDTASSSAPAPAEPMLQASDLRRSFGGVDAVAGASFAVRPGTITGLIGPNGAGKSTVINIIGGQMRPDGGRVLFRGREIQGLPPHRVARAGLVRTFQTANVFARLTVLENLLLGARPWDGETFHAALLGRWFWRRRETELVDRAESMLDRFGMRRMENDDAGTLSGGQKRILEIMRALMSEPVMLLLDEPMAGVNPTLAHTIGDHLHDLRVQGMTMLMIEHDLALVDRLCDSVVVMAQGRVLAEGSLRDLRQSREVLDAYLAG
ncbi:MAG: ABC transporter ATP-binding protein [Candidatus Dormiibacterota bacterium]